MVGALTERNAAKNDFANCRMMFFTILYSPFHTSVYFP
jgi:hypothetical protein